MPLARVSFANSAGTSLIYLGFAMGGQLKKGAQPPSQLRAGRAISFWCARARVVRGAWCVARGAARGRAGRQEEGRGASFLRGRQPGWTGSGCLSCVR